MIISKSREMIILTNRMRSAASSTATNGIASYCNNIASYCNSCVTRSIVPLQLLLPNHGMIRSFHVASTRNISAATTTTFNSVTGKHRSSVGSLFLFTTTTPSTSTTEVEEESSLLSQRDIMMYDVCIVGGGPAGLSAAIRIKQLCQQYSNQKQISVCVIDKGRYALCRVVHCTERYYRKLARRLCLRNRQILQYLTNVCALVSSPYLYSALQK